MIDVRHRGGFLNGLPAELWRAKQDERRLEPSPGAALIKPLTYICQWHYFDGLSLDSFLLYAIARSYKTSLYLYDFIVYISPHLIG